MRLFCRKGRGLVDLAANDVTRDDHDDAQQERNTPTPGHELILRHEVGERQEDTCREQLPCLHALEGKARKVSTPSERRMFENHRAGAGHLSRDRESLNEPQDDEQHRRPDADLLVGGQEAHTHRCDAHQEHAEDQHCLAAVAVADVPSTIAPIGRAT